LKPQYPASSPWVLAVGGTSGPEFGKSEITCQSNPDSSAFVAITSGGGFSTLFPQPSYQSRFVQSYLRSQGSSLPPQNTFNASQRAYPDVSLISNNIDMINGQAWLPGAGTSASCPLFAALLVRALDARLALGASPFGRINDLL
jgi:tripeptidyl-peptidase-1